MFLLVSSVFLTRFFLRAQESFSPNPDFVDALWVATSRGIIKFALPDGTVLFRVSDTKKIDTVAIDERAGIIWGYGNKTLHAIGFNGELLLSTSLRRPRHDWGKNYEHRWDKDKEEDDDNDDDNDEHDLDHDGDKAVLQVNPNDGTVWLGKDKLLYHFDNQGELLNTLTLSHEIETLVFDKGTSRLWVATEKTVSAYDETGTHVIALDLERKPEVKDIAVDQESGEIWVGMKGNRDYRFHRKRRWDHRHFSKEKLRRYGVDGTIVFETGIKELEFLASDGQGGVWIADGNQLVRMDSAGLILLELNPLRRHKKIIDLVGDPLDGSVWVAGKEVINHVSGNGEILTTIEKRERKWRYRVYNFKGQIRDLVLYRDLTPPVLTFTSPTEGNWINIRTPSIQLNYSDVGSGVDPSTLSIVANGTELPISCDFNEGLANCTPNTALPEGPVNLTAVIEDFVGNPSQSATLNFSVDTIPPVINFTSPNNGAEINTSTPTLKVSFSDLGSGINASSYGMLVNGANVTSSDAFNSSSAAYTTKIPLLPGDNEATAIISDLAGNTQSATIRFNVSVFRAIANCGPTEGEAPLEVHFRGRGEFHGGSIIRYRWDIEGDGVFETSDEIVRDFSHKFDKPGTFVSVLEVTNNFGERATDTCTIAVAPIPPVVTADVNPSNGPAPLTVTFTGTGLKKDGAIVLHEWDFDGDGIFDFTTSTFDPIPRPTAITFFLNHATCGSFNAFNFFLNDVLIGTTTGTISCVCNPSEPSFTITDSVALSNWNETGVNMLRVDFGSSLAVGYVRAELTYETSTVEVCIFDQRDESCVQRNLCNGFRFGGSFSAPVAADVETTRSVDHTYTSQGMFNAVFRVTDNVGLMATASPVATSVRVGPPGTPVVEATASPTSGSEALTVSFNGSATDDGTITKWEWDFDGDGVFDLSSSTSPETTFTYANAGIYPAALRATDNTGLTSTDLIEITVELTPTLSIPDDTFNPTAGEMVLINTSLSAGAPIRIFLKDRNGAVVRTLIDETRAAGSYSDTWDGKDDAGQLLLQGPYYAVLEYESNGESRSFDLTHSTGGVQYFPSRSHFSSTFRPLEDNLQRIIFTIPSSQGASEILAVIGLLQSNTRFITMLEQVPLGVGQHTIYWDGLDSNGNFALPPPGDRFILGLIGTTLPNNTIFLEAAPVLSNVTVDPNYFDPSTPDFINPTDPTASISYDLDKLADVELTVTNLKTGRVLRRIRQSNVPAGTGHSISWDGHASDGFFADKGDYRLTLQAIDTTGSPSLLRYVLMRVFY